MTRKRITALCGLGIVLLALVAIGWSSYRYRRGKYMPPPVLMGHCYTSFQERMADVVASEGGLPKSDAMLLQCGTFLSPVSLYPVEQWGIERIMVENLHGPLGARNPTYRVVMEVRVQYEDGDVALLRWTVQNHGYHIGPLVISQGIGPPWEISLVRPDNGLDRS